MSEDELSKSSELNNSLNKLLKIKLVKSIGDNNYKINNKFKFKSLNIDFKRIKPTPKNDTSSAKLKSIEIDRDIVTQCAIMKTMKHISPESIDKDILFDKIRENKNVLK